MWLALLGHVLLTGITEEQAEACKAFLGLELGLTESLAKLKVKGKEGQCTYVGQKRGRTAFSDCTERQV
jgi:hypothetical protein